MAILGVLPPSSRVNHRLRFSVFDVFWASVAPLVALCVRDAYVLSYDGATTVAVYCLVSTLFALVAFLAFRLRDAMPQYFSVHDAIAVAKAVILAELMTCVVLFTFTRLDGIPRSTPVIHALILGAGLVAARAFIRVARKEGDATPSGRPLASKGVILIGLNDLSSLYMKCLEAFVPGEYRVIAVLDDGPKSIGRSIHGVRVMGPPAHLESVIDEFKVHGIRTDRVVVGGDATFLSDEMQNELRRVCAKHDIDLEFAPRLFGFRPRTPALSNGGEPPIEATVSTVPNLALPPYLNIKRVIDFVAALVLLLVLSPLWAMICMLAFIDVRSPVIFWQQRLGVSGRNFLLYKIRTLRPPFDWQGQKIPEEQRLSWIGRLLRRTRVDEWPQLLNVLVGDMSLIGPRPLLPRDQPPGPTVRLMMRPGLTGWAQVHGGHLLSPEEKDALDEWYIRHASLWLDLRIMGMTVRCLIRGDRRGSPLAPRADKRPAPSEPLREREDRRPQRESPLGVAAWGSSLAGHDIVPRQLSR